VSNKYVPVKPSGREDAAVYAYEELLDLSQALSESQEFLALQVLNVAPAKPRDGMVAVADGTNWNPGGGAGIYARIGGAWVKL
jgi:hypothetical protein